MSKTYNRVLLAGLCSLGVLMLSSVQAAQKAKPARKETGPVYSLYNMTKNGALFFDQASVVRDGDVVSGAFYWMWTDGSPDLLRGASANCSKNSFTKLEKHSYDANGKIVYDHAVALSYASVPPTGWQETFYGLLCGTLKVKDSARYSSVASMRKMLNAAVPAPAKREGHSFYAPLIGSTAIYFADLNSREKNGDIVKMATLIVQGRDTPSPNGTYRHLVEFYEFDCKARTRASKRIHAYGTDGALIAVEITDEAMGIPGAKTASGILLGIACDERKDDFAEAPISDVPEAIRRGRIFWATEQ